MITPPCSYITAYRRKAYVPIDTHGWLVLLSVTLAIELYVVKVGLLGCYSPILVMYCKTLNFPRFFEFLVPKLNNFFLLSTLSSLLFIDCLIKQYNGEEEKEQQHPQQAATMAEAAGTAI